MIVTFLALIQENKPKIVITGPAAKEGQINRGYGMLEVQNNHSFFDDQLDVISRSSNYSYYTAGDQTPTAEGTCLAARGHIATCKRPITQLQIPDMISQSSTDSIYENATSNHSTRRSSLKSQASMVHNNKMNGSPNISIGNGSVCSKLVQVDRQTKPTYHRSPSSPSAQSMEFYTPCKNPPLLSSSKTRRPKPALKRQDATEDVEMICIDIENQNHISLSPNCPYLQV